jgi:hypothetical protein
VLARPPLQNLLKNGVHADRTPNAAFFFWAGQAWYLKPFAGILTDALPLFGGRRKSSILISTSTRLQGRKKLVEKQYVRLRIAIMRKKGIMRGLSC